MMRFDIVTGIIHLDYGLELYVWKQARRVLRGQWGRKAPALPEFLLFAPTSVQSDYQCWLWLSTGIQVIPGIKSILDDRLEQE